MVKSTEEIGAFEAKTRLGELLRETEKGRSFVIRRRGRAVARLVPPGDERGEMDLPKIVDEFRDIRQRVLPGPGIRQLIEEGRRF